MDCRIVNCTQNEVRLVSADGVKTLEPSGHVPCIVESPREWQPDGVGFPVVVLRECTTDVSGLPDPEDGVWLVVDRMVFDAADTRDDLLAPYDFEKDEQGRIWCHMLLARLPGQARANMEKREFLELGRGESAAGCL